jgi:hypothetical protein
MKISRTITDFHGRQIEPRELRAAAAWAILLSMEEQVAHSRAERALLGR